MPRPNHPASSCTAIVRKAIAVVRPQFRLSFAHGTHGVPHWTRVWFHGRSLAASLDVNPSVLAWFAFLHHSQRHNDYTDPLHGTRAADFALSLRPRRCDHRIGQRRARTLPAAEIAKQ
jgi:uncharacterized protein